MLKYYLWAVGEKALSYFPAGYNGLGHLTTRTLMRRLVGCGTSYHLVRKARELKPAKGRFLILARLGIIMVGSRTELGYCI